MACRTTSLVGVCHVQPLSELQPAPTPLPLPARLPACPPALVPETGIYSGMLTDCDYFGELRRNNGQLQFQQYSPDELRERRWYCKVRVFSPGVKHTANTLSRRQAL